MSETVPSGAQGPAPAETSSAPQGGSPSNETPAATTAQFGVFGHSRGSGLARGKRPAAAAPAAGAPATAGYKPTAIEVITPQREYVNPFEPEKSAPVATAPVETEQPAPARPVAIAPTPAPAPRPTPAPQPVAATPAPAPAAKPAFATPATEQVAPFAPDDEPKAELKILPPAVNKAPAQSWEASPAAATGNDRPRSRHDERPTFRPARRDNPESAGEVRPRTPREPRESRPAPVSETPAAKSGGFLGWLKGLFGGPAEPAATGTPAPRRDDGERGEHRRHRGGRGRNRNFNGPRDGQSRGPGEGRGRRDEQSGEGGGPKRRRRRGGRNRNREGGGPRSEGQQGGGAI